MCKKCVFITGTNCTGKSTLARAIIDTFGGGVRLATKELTYCNNPSVAFIGKYGSGKYGGVDGLNETKGLQGIVEKALEGAEIVFGEGVYLHTFGLNLQRALFSAQKSYVIFLYADSHTISKRLGERTGSLLNRSILNDQRTAYRSAVKWKEAGVIVVPINTAITTVEEEIKIIKDKIFDGIL